MATNNPVLQEGRSYRSNPHIKPDNTACKKVFHTIVHITKSSFHRAVAGARVPVNGALEILVIGKGIRLSETLAISASIVAGPSVMGRSCEPASLNQPRLIPANLRRASSFFLI